MATNFRAQEKAERALIGDIMADDNDDFFDLRMSMGKSTSAPPPGLSEPFSSSSPRMKPATIENDKTATKEYYEYYYSLKPLDPRLPKPKWKPNLYGASTFGVIHPIQEDPQEGKITRNSSDRGFANDDLSTQFDQSIGLEDSGFSQPQSFSGNNNNAMQYQNQGNKGYQSGHYQQGQHHQHHNQHQNQYHQQQQHHQHQPHYQQQQQRQHQGYKGQGQGHGHGGQNMQGHQGQGYSHPRQQQQGKHQQNPNFGGGFNQGQGQYDQQGQFYGGNQQMQGMYDPNFMKPQMSVPVQPYFGMNPYQQQMFPYPNMNPNMANMNPMGGMNQFYPTPYMQPYYPMQPQMPGNFQQGPYPVQQQQQQQHQHQQHQQQQQQQQQGHKGQKNFNKMNMSNNPNMPKQDMKSVLMRLIENCRDQNGSRLIQQHFEKADEAEREQMFQQILPHAFSLMTDVFGNYVIQKILELGNDDQKVAIYETMEGRILELCQNTYGCRVVQRALETNEEIQDKILEEISVNVLELIEDQNGNHVIQKCFENTPPEKLKFIISEVSKNIDKLAFHAFGCRVIQRILEYCPSEMTSSMSKKLMEYAIKCCECQYGNYIMQHILEKGPQDEKQQLLKIVSHNFVTLSMNKFASNVTEKSAIHGTPEFKKDVVHVLLNTYHENKLGLIALMTHPYGNYVVQRLFECSPEQLRRTIYEATQGPNADEIKKTSYGKHVMGLIEKLMEGKQRN